MKSYLFEEKHLMPDGTYRRFDASDEVAEAWKRLMDGKATDDDILLFNHELTEMHLVKEGIPMDAAHRIASIDYDWSSVSDIDYFAKKCKEIYGGDFYFGAGTSDELVESVLKNMDGVDSSLDDVIEGGTGVLDDIITDGSHIENGQLKPNIKYQTGEYRYSYETDSNGRISNWNTDNLQMTTRDKRLNHNPDTPGKKDGDHAGHLVGDRFGGSPELDNLVSQSQNVNLSRYKKIENQWAKAIGEGREVTVNVEIKYDGDDLRPVEFIVEYTIDGDLFIESILN